MRQQLHSDIDSEGKQEEMPKTAKALSCPVCGSPLQWIETIPRE